MPVRLPGKHGQRLVQLALTRNADHVSLHDRVPTRQHEARQVTTRFHGA